MRAAYDEAAIGLRSPAPVFAVRDLDAAMAFYERLGFAVRRHDAGYGYAEREGLRIHLRASPELEIRSRTTPRSTSTPPRSTGCTRSGRRAVCCRFRASSGRS